MRLTSRTCPQRSVGGLPQRSFEFGVELSANRGHLLIAKLPEERGGLVVFKGPTSRRILVQDDPQRRIERCRQFVSCHPRRSQRVTDLVLKCLARPAGNLQDRAMITFYEDEKFRAPFQLVRPLFVALGEGLHYFRIQ